MCKSPLLHFTVLVAQHIPRQRIFQRFYVQRQTRNCVVRHERLHAFESHQAQTENQEPDSVLAQNRFLYLKVPVDGFIFRVRFVSYAGKRRGFFSD